MKTVVSVQGDRFLINGKLFARIGKMKRFSWHEGNTPGRRVSRDD